LKEFLLSAEEVLRSSRGEGLETMAFWGMGFWERRVHLGGLRERRCEVKVELGNWEGGWGWEEENLREERRVVAAEEDEPPEAAIEIGRGWRKEWVWLGGNGNENGIIKKCKLD
jgi:hypothetical protein